MSRLCSFARASSFACLFCPSGPISAKPLEKTTAARTPACAADSSNSGTWRPGIAVTTQSHHLQSHDRYLKIDLHRFWRHMGNALDEQKAFLKQLISRDDLVDEPDAERLLCIDMIPDETIAQRILEPGQQRPHKSRIGTVAYLGLGKHRVI